jgi:hypothetical protein
MATKREKQQAQALVDLEFDPQFRQIRDLWGQTRSQYLNDLSAARNRARATQQVARTSQPKTAGFFDAAKKDLKGTNQTVDQAIAAVGPGTPSGLSGLIQTAMARERGAAQNRVSTEKASALTDLEKKITGAEAGKTLAYTTAKGNLLNQRKDLTQKLQDLSGDRGNKMTALLGEMVGARSEANAQSRAAANKRLTSGPYRGLTQGQVDSMSAQDLRDYEKQNEKDTGKGKGKGRATNDQIRQLSDDFKAALQFAKDYSAQKAPRPQAADDLLRGRVPKKGESFDPTPKFGQLPASLALDMAYDGHISRANAQRLHKLGYKVNDLTGAISYTNRPKPKPKPRAPKRPPNVFERSPFA